MLVGLMLDLGFGTIFEWELFLLHSGAEPSFKTTS